MNQRLSYGKVAPAVYKGMLALQDSVDKSGLEKDLMDLVCLRISQINGCAFCIDMHWRDLRAKGFNQQQLYLLSVGARRRDIPAVSAPRWNGPNR